MGEATAAGRPGLADVLPDYELLGELGRGAMGVVMAARHRALGRVVAVKELPAAFAADQSVRSRFLREGQALASLDHPHIVVIHDFIERDGHLALIMEKLVGGSLWDELTAFGVGSHHACGLMLSVVSGLDHAHRHGVLHRDIKPENLLFTADRQLKVTDFGMAKILGGDRTMATMEGVVLGTPAYMAPEQAEGAEVGAPADVYACATVLYELLTRTLPFEEARTDVAMLVARVRDDAPPVRDKAAHLPPSVASVVDTALARDPADRYDRIEDFGVALAEAASSAWGPDWLDETGVVVQGSAAIERASRSSLKIAPAWETEERWGKARETVLDLRDQLPEEEPPQPRQADKVHRSAPSLTRMEPSQLVDLSELTLRLSVDDGGGKRGRRPRTVPALAWLLWLIALGLALAAVVVVGSALAAADEQQPVSNPLVINGRPVTSEPVPVSFEEPLVIGGIADGGGASRARLEVSFRGVTLGGATADLAGGQATFTPEYFHLTTAAVVDLAVHPIGSPEAVATVAVAPTHRWWLNAPFGAVVVVGMAALALVSNQRRSRRERRTSTWASVLRLGVSTTVLAAAGCAGLVMAVQAVPPPVDLAIGSLCVGGAAMAAALARGRVRAQGLVISLG